MTTTESSAGRYRIAEIAELSGFSPSTLRYYERAGVLAAPDRTPAGYRHYSERDLERLRLIARAKDLGCSLDEITELARAWDDDECGPVKHRLRTLVEDKVAAVEAHLADQAAFAVQLRDTAAVLAGRPLDGPCDDACGCTGTTAVADPVPIASSLSATDVAARVEDWNVVLSQVARRLPLSGGVRLELSDRTQLPALAALVDAEQTCCPFFSFAITVD